jgi:hypothetical protein
MAGAGTYAQEWCVGSFESWKGTPSHVMVYLPSANPRKKVFAWPWPTPFTLQLTVPGAACVISLKSVTGEVKLRIYPLVISVRAEPASSSAFTGDVCAAIDVSASASTVTSSDTEATTSGSETSAVPPAVTTTPCRTCVANPVAEVSTV